MTVTSGSIMLLPATLTGMGRRARYEVLVRKKTTILNGTVPQFSYTYTDCSIIGAPDDLPDGEYVVSFEDFTVSATCHGANWLANGQAQKHSKSESESVAAA